MTTRAVRFLTCDPADAAELLWQILRTPHPELPWLVCLWAKTVGPPGRRMLVHAYYAEAP